MLENPEIKVVNMSLGGPKSSETEPLKAVIKRLEDAGVAVCIAAGNEAQNTKNVASPLITTVSLGKVPTM